LFLLLLPLARNPAMAEPCGQVIGIITHDATTTRYVLSTPADGAAASPPTTLLLLPGGDGHLGLDDDGCPALLAGNSLVRMQSLFQRDGFATALADTPSDHAGEDGLKGFRIERQHAEDLGGIILDLRRRVGGAVWLLGTSRGTISAVNAASHLRGPAAPDGLVLTSVLTNGDSRARKTWVAQTVFDLPLETLAMPVLLVGHKDDRCIRSPPDMMAEVAARLNHVTRRQVAVVAGGSGGSESFRDIASCRGQSPHGFFGQEDEVAATIARFIHGAPDR